jgi:hypothetical protein
MAELLGAVAGGIGIASFVIQIGDSLVKLKRFKDSIRDAPEELRCLIQNLEDLSKILESIGTRAQQCQIPDGEDDIIDKSLIDCHGAARNIYQVAKEIEQIIVASGRKGRVKFAIKKQIMESLRSRLEEAKATVLLSHVARATYVISCCYSVKVVIRRLLT